MYLTMLAVCVVNCDWHVESLNGPALQSLPADYSEAHRAGLDCKVFEGFLQGANFPPLFQRIRAVSRPSCQVRKLVILHVLVSPLITIQTSVKPSRTPCVANDVCKGPSLRGLSPKQARISVVREVLHKANGVEYKLSSRIVRLGQHTWHWSTYRSHPTRPHMIPPCQCQLHDGLEVMDFAGISVGIHFGEASFVDVHPTGGSDPCEYSTPLNPMRMLLHIVQHALFLLVVLHGCG